MTMTMEEAIQYIDGLRCEEDFPYTDAIADFIKERNEAIDMAIEALSSEAEWIPLSYDDYGLVTDFPHERDGEWVIVTDGKNISVERIKKDAYDHFFPNGRWFELEDAIAWMPLPKPYKGGDTE